MRDNEVIEVHGGRAFYAFSEDMLTLTHVIYALHATAVVIGALGAATIVGSFIFGLPSIVAVILNYLNRGKVRDTLLESHFRWQIRTFWYALLWAVLMGVLVLTIVGIPIALVGFLVTGLWVVYRVVRGWLALKERRPMPIWPL